MSRKKSQQQEPTLARAARLTLAALAGFILAHSGVTPEQAFAFLESNLEALLTLAGLGTLAATGPATRLQQMLESPAFQKLAEKIRQGGRTK